LSSCSALYSGVDAIGDSLQAKAFQFDFFARFFFAVVGFG
jgi:hypothetical protein